MGLLEHSKEKMTVRNGIRGGTHELDLDEGV